MLDWFFGCCRQGRLFCNLILSKHATNNDRTVSIFVKEDVYEIILDNIEFNKNLHISTVKGFWINLATTIFNANIKRITIDKSGKIDPQTQKLKTGEIKIYSQTGTENTNEYLRSYISALINWGAQEKIKNVLDCPGVQFDLKDFMKNVFPLIEVLLKYLYDTESIKSTTLIISDANKKIVREKEINIIQIINDIRTNIDNKIKEYILRLPGVKKKLEEQKKDESMITKLRNNYTNTEIERRLLKQYNINDAVSIQGMINNIPIKKQYITANNQGAANTYGSKQDKLIENLYNVMYKLGRSEVIDNDTLNTIFDRYTEMMGNKKAILAGALTNELIIAFYKGTYGNILNKYIITKSMIISTKAPEDKLTQYFNILNGEFKADIREYIEKSNIKNDNASTMKNKLDLLIEIYENKDASPEIKELTKKYIIDIVKQIRETITALNCPIEKTVKSFWKCTIISRLAKQYPTLIGQYDIIKYIKDNIKEVHSILVIYDAIVAITRDNTDTESIKYILKNTGGLLIKSNEYNKLNITEADIKDSLLPELRQIAGDDEIQIEVIRPTSGIFSFSRIVILSTNEQYGGSNNIYHKKYIKYKTKYNNLKLNI